ncbi:MAG: DUF4215 domain-containing protein [Polyangiaceae bacterium]
MSGEVTTMKTILRTGFAAACAALLAVSPGCSPDRAEEAENNQETDGELAQVQQGAGAAQPDTVLILSTTVSGGASSREAFFAQALGYNVEIVTAAQWATKSTADFATYRAIIFGDTGANSIASYAAPNANKAVWSPAVTGNIIIVGTDPVDHRNQGGDSVTLGSIYYAVAEPGKTGLYACLSSAYESQPDFTPVAFLSEITNVTSSNAGCYNNAHKVADHIALDLVTDATLSNWSCSVHSFIDSFEPDFLPLAIAKDATGPGSMAFPDGTYGYPYIIARGVDLSPVNCGNNLVDAGEECDDGNTDADDGCSATCTIEAGYDCQDEPSACASICGDGLIVGGEECDDLNATGGDGCSDVCAVEAGYQCLGEPSACGEICGDGMIVGVETCDDNNTMANDGCSAMCQTEMGYACTGEPSACTVVCGDGIIVVGKETCDDNNGAAGDGCSDTCLVEAGWTCMGLPSACNTTCGDGIIAGAEACDDANANSGDGCSATCAFEPGWTCMGQPTACAENCGDGMAVGTEQCDDGNTNSGDGCDPVCDLEAGYACTGTPSVCAAVCGDGIKLPQEACDDGNTVSGDCCAADCNPEAFCELEPNNTPATANDFASLQQNNLVKASIKPIADVDCFSFTNTTPVDARVEVFDGNGPSTCASMDPYMRFYNAAGTQLGVDDDDGVSLCPLMQASTDAWMRQLPPSTYSFCVEELGNNALINLYTVQLTFTAVCGNGMQQGFEECDDGNQTPGDGCENNCKLSCGNGIVDPVETCDDGNKTAGDGCSATCQIEAGWTCSGAPSMCMGICGNGVVTGAETCDDGNTAPGDGCGSNCTVELGYACNGSPSLCVPSCGNGVVNGTDQCDDANLNNGDGCSSTCQIEPGYSCSGSPSVCFFTCGNGTIEGEDQCDDGNTTPGDGCSAGCKVEPFYQCGAAVPSVCTISETLCNDGVDNDGDGMIDGADSDCTLPAYFNACGAGQLLAIYPSGNVNIAIPDSSGPPITSKVFSTIPGTINKVAVLYDITHTYDGDMDISINKTGGPLLDICSDNGGTGENFTSTILDSTCASPVTSGSAPFSACYTPETSLATYNNTSALTGWTLTCDDDAGGDLGTLNFWKMVMCLTP